MSSRCQTCVKDRQFGAPTLGRAGDTVSVVPGPATVAAPRWGVGHAFAVLLLAQLTPTLALVVVGETVAPVPLWAIAVAQLAGAGAYVGVSTAISRSSGEGPVADFALAVRPRDVAVWVPIGAATQLLGINGLYSLLNLVADLDAGEAARDLADRADGATGAVLLIWIALVVAPAVEEFFFRGVLLGALRRRFDDRVALGVSAVVFALVHFQLVQAPGLIVIGLVCGVALLRTERLGAAWAAHLGFNLTAVVQLMVFSG